MLFTKQNTTKAMIGKKGAEKLLHEVTGLFAGGELAEEDKDELMLAIQEAYVDAKKRNKKYTPKKYLQEQSLPDES